MAQIMKPSLFFYPTEHQQNVSHTEVKSLMDSLSFAVSALRDELTEDSSRSSGFQSFQHTQHILSKTKIILININRIIT